MKHTRAPLIVPFIGPAAGTRHPDVLADRGWGRPEAGWYRGGLTPDEGWRRGGLTPDGGWNRP